MTAMTVMEIKRQFSAKLVEAQHARDARIREISELRQPSGDTYLIDRLDEAQRAKLLREQKAAAAEEDRRHRLDALKQAHALYAQEISSRRDHLDRRLFAVEGSEGAALLARAATAPKEELAALLDVAAQARNAELARAVFSVAHRRDEPELIHRYLSEIDPEARDLYDEYKATPSPEVVERQGGDPAQMIGPASAEQLAGSPPVFS